MGNRSGLVSIHVLLKDAEFASELTLRATATYFCKSYRKEFCNPPRVRRRHTLLLSSFDGGYRPRISPGSGALQGAECTGLPLPSGLVEPLRLNTYLRIGSFMGPRGLGWLLRQPAAQVDHFASIAGRLNDGDEILEIDLDPTPATRADNLRCPRSHSTFSSWRWPQWKHCT
jgi:hypothetical protein